MEINNQKLKQYFMETLSTQGVEEVDLRIILDADFAAELDVAETELIEDYLENSLSKEETKLFETNFLVTNERQERLEFLKSLKQFAKNATKKIELPDMPPRFFESLRNLLSPRQVAVGFGVLILLVALGIAWRVFSPANNQNNPELAAMNRQDLSNLDEFKNSTNLTLVSGNLRSGGNGNNLELKNLTDKVLFRLALPPNTPLDTTFQVNFLQDKNVIFTLNKVRIYGSDVGQEIRLVIPAPLLKKGEYQIELQRENLTETKIIYNFSIRDK